MPPRHARPPRIAVIAQPDYEYSRKLLLGVAEYCTSRALDPVWINSAYRPVPDPRRWGADGVIAAIVDGVMARQIRGWGLPAINVSARIHLSDIPLVTMDNRAVGAAAARHLVERGAVQFAYLGALGHGYAEDRREGFLEETERHGHRAAVRMIRGGQRAGVHNRETAQWLAGHPRPVGVMACNDQWAALAAQICRGAGLRVPSEVMLVGSDNDVLHCLLSQPSISSVHNDYERAGREAARLLERWLVAGERAPCRTLIAPGQVVARRSSGPTEVGDPLIDLARRLIADRATRGLTVEGLVEAMPVGRRKLEQVFRRVLGRSPAEEIRRVQIDRARQLLADTDLTLDEVAAASGMGYKRQMRMRFRRELGTSPATLRRGFQGGTASVPATTPPSGAPPRGGPRKRKRTPARETGR